MSPAAKRHGSLGEVGATAAGGPAHSNQHQQQHGAEEMRVLQEEVVRLQEALEKQAVQMGYVCGGGCDTALVVHVVSLSYPCRILLYYCSITQ